MIRQSRRKIDMWQRIYGLRLTRFRVRFWHECEKCENEFRGEYMWTFKQSYQYSTRTSTITIWQRKYICASCAPNRDSLVRWFERIRHRYPDWKVQQ